MSKEGEDLQVVDGLFEEIMQSEFGCENVISVEALELCKALKVKEEDEIEYVIKQAMECMDNHLNIKE